MQKQNDPDIEQEMCFEGSRGQEGVLTCAPSHSCLQEPENRILQMADGDTFHSLPFASGTPRLLACITVPSSVVYNEYHVSHKNGEFEATS